MDRYITVNLQDIRKEMQCPICLGIIRKTRTVMECLHRFCRECIDKSMRLGNNECPSCRTHCASRRSLRDDPNFDALIAAIYPDIDKYEEQEAFLLDEERRKNEQIQASIADTFRRQNQAVVRRRSSSSKATAAAIVRKAHSFRGVQASRSRGRGRGRGRSTYSSRSRYEEEDDDDDDDDEDEDDDDEQDEDEYQEAEEEDHGESSEEESFRLPERKRRRSRVSVSSDNSEQDRGAHQSQNAANHSEGMPSSVENSAQKVHDGAARAEEDVVTWAVAGARSQSRHGNGVPDQNRHHRLQISALWRSVESNAVKERASELHIFINLQPLKNEAIEENLPDLERPHISCPPKMTVHQVLQLLDLRLSPRPKGELEVLVAKDQQCDGGPPDSKTSQQQMRIPTGSDYEVLNPSIPLKEVFSDSTGGNCLALLYRLKTCGP